MHRFRDGLQYRLPVLELARSEFLLRRENVLLLGNSGTGKTHLALALGLSACQRGQRVRFTTAAMVHELMEAKDEKRLLRFQKQMASYELLIVDELGFVPLSKSRAELLFEVFSQSPGSHQCKDKSEHEKRNDQSGLDGCSSVSFLICISRLLGANERG